jgi:hypothetical protein
VSDDITRFKAKTRREGECLIWTAGKDAQGYGKFRFRGSTWRAHRVSYELFCGPTDDFEVIHVECCNPACVRPEHLALDNGEQRTALRLARGHQTHLPPQRNVTPDRHRARTHPETYQSGEKHPGARLTFAQVTVIRDRAAKGEQLKTLAEEYGVDPSLISRIKLGKAWR